MHTGDTPAVGDVAIFQYPGEPHYAIITKLETGGFWVRDSNFGGPGIRTHFYSWDSIRLRGFYNPGGDGA